MLLPVAQQVTTAVAFHPVDNGDAVAFTPAGERLGGGDLGQKLADIFAGGGGVQYYLMDGEGGEQSSSTAGLDVGAVPGSPVLSPVDGKVTRSRSTASSAATRTSRSTSGWPPTRRCCSSSRTSPSPRSRSATWCSGARRRWVPCAGSPQALDQALSQYTSDNGDHVQLVMLRVTPELAQL